MENVEDIQVAWRYGQARDLIQSHNELLEHVAQLARRQADIVQAHNKLIRDVTEIIELSTQLSRRVKELQRRLDEIEQTREVTECEQDS